jgi:tetratricopeptide (TPR) repeat protein
MGIVGRVVGVSNFIPDALAERSQALEWAEKIVARGENLTSLVYLGATLYRAGRFDEAVERLEAGDKKAGSAVSAMRHQAWCFLAMAHHRLGHAAEARRWLDKAAQQTERLKAQAFGPRSSAVAIQLLHREAEALIQGKTAEPDK